MYGTIQPLDGGQPHVFGEVRVRWPVHGGSSASIEKNRSAVTWELVLLMTSEFLTFALLLTPLIPDTETSRDIESFWRTYRFLALAACVPYLLLTAPVAIGYTWVLRRWPTSIIVWSVVVLSLGTVVQIASVSTDPRGVFVGTCSIGGYLMLLSLLTYYDTIRYSKPTAFALGFFWHCAVFVPVYFTDGVSLYSSIGSATASIVCTTFIVAELRIMESGSLIGLSAGERYDPFTLAIWTNCGSWRFVVQVYIFCTKLFFQCLELFFGGIIKAWRFIVSKFVQCTPSQWFTPKTARKVANLTRSDV